MSTMSSLRFPLAFVSTFLLPTVGLAAQPHTWCTAGNALIKNDSDTDTDTNTIITNVCGNSDFAGCCSDGGSSARWGLACVQKAADYALKQNKLGGDYCGRYAWIQGPVANSKQYYPRDFNLVALSGNADSIRDADGPVAAKGNVTFSYFNLNIAKREQIALLSAGRVSLSNGTVNGSVQYRTTYSGANVTFFDATKPTAATSPSLIDFDSTKSKLVTMSQAIRDHYSVNGTTAKPYSTLTFTGSDAELNVFKIDASLLANATTYAFSVPAGSAAIVTVAGTSPAFKNAGFTGAPSASKLLWNFPDATSLTLNGIGFPGSILAPNAAANLNNGNIRGTVVVASASPAYVELYSAPLQLGCSGGLCLDKTWSTSSDTAIADDGTAADIASEAGFIEIEGGAYRNEGYDRASPKHRVFYTFHPAKSDRKNKPVAVFFNGGPGAGTTPFLFSFNTGPKTLDPQITSSITSNPNSWTSFANLLFIDAPGTGFSYPLKNPDMSEPELGTDMDRDAANFVRVLVRFLARHPTIQKNRIVIVGESYGGIRATLMLKHVYEYASLALPHTSDDGFKDTQLSSELASYFSAVLGTATPSASQIITKFGHQILIEPALVGDEQQDAFETITTPSSRPYIPHYAVNSEFPMSNCKAPFPDDPTPCWSARSPDPDYGVSGRQPSCDAYNCDRDANWSGDLERQAATKLTALATLSSALNVNAKTIAWMNDETRRTMAYGRASTTDFHVDSITPVDLDATSNFGPLNSDDAYLVLQSGRVNIEYGWRRSYPPGTPPAAKYWRSPGVGAMTGGAFAAHVRNGVKSFITVSKYDAVIWTPSIGKALNGFGGTLGTLMLAGYASNYPSIVSSHNQGQRPGVLKLQYDSVPDGDILFVTTPGPYNAGHTIPMRAASDLLTDASIWYAN